MPKPYANAWSSYQFWGLLVTLTCLLLMGGSSRMDVQSLALLNPAMILCSGAALLTLKPEHLHRNKGFLAFFAFFFLLAALYLTPLPSQFELMSKGLDDVAAIRAEANASSASYVLAVAPAAAWQSFFFLFGPMAVCLFGIQLNRAALWLTLPIVILMGSISGMVGVLQLVGGSDNPLYLYRITNYGSAVGLFANRNHAAVLLACLFPMLAVYARRPYSIKHSVMNTSQLIAASLAAILVPLVLVTGSRSGVLAAVVGLIGGVLLYVSHGATNKAPKASRFLTPMFAIMCLFCLVIVTLYFSRAEAIERIFAEQGGGDNRSYFWTLSLGFFWQYFPVGFGPGSFASVFQVSEPRDLLGGGYLNRLHNDWLETTLTFGVSAILVMLYGVAYFIRRSFRLWILMDSAHSGVALGRMGSVVIAILAIASMSDYPLRTPAIMGFAVLAFIWFVDARDSAINEVDRLGVTPGSM